MTTLYRDSQAAAAAAAILSIYRDIEGSASIPIPHPGIGSMIEQQFGDIVVVVIESDHQRRYAFRRRQIHVGAFRNQLLNAVIAAVACAIQQGCQSSEGMVLHARLLRNM